MFSSGQTEGHADPPRISGRVRRQALSLLAAEGLVGQEQIPVAHRVLRAAACTYLVAALFAIMELALIALEIALSAED